MHGSIVIILIFAILSVFILMQSPLNPFAKQITDIDSSVFIYGANRIREGKIPYRDFFDHKGPILYLIEVIGLSLANGNVIGIWIIEVLFMFLNFLLLYKISQLFSKNKIVNILAVFLSTVPLFTFFSEGNFTEEYALPFMLYALYTFLKFIKNNDIKRREIIFNGICFAMVLLMKVNLVMLWVVNVLIVIYIYIKNKKYKEFIRTILLFLLGVLIVFLPVILYFLINNAISDLFYCVFTFNCKYVGYKGTMPKKLEILQFFLKASKLSVIALILGIANLVKRIVKKQKYIANVSSILYFIVVIIELTLIGRNYIYYANIFIPALIVPFTESLENIKDLKNFKIKIMVIILFIVILGIASKEHIIDQFNKVEKQFKYARNSYLVNKIQENSKENDNVLMLWNSCALYNFSNRKYEGKYMYQVPPILSDDKILDEILEELENNKPDLIVFPYEYEIFQKITYTYDYCINNIKETYPEFLENKTTFDYINRRLETYFTEIKNINVMFNKIDEMTKEGLYTLTIYDYFTIWKLN